MTARPKPTSDAERVTSECHQARSDCMALAIVACRSKHIIHEHEASIELASDDM
jgi:hypothetical protein